MAKSENNSPLFTIIMVTYNSSKYIKTAIEGVLHSSYSNIELIIQDDNSNDNTWDIICSYNDKRIIKEKNNTNIGEYPNRNKALNRAKGKYLLFLDGDDFIYPHAIEFIVKMFEAFPNCGMATMGVYRTDVIYPVTITPKQFAIAELFGDFSSRVGFTSVIFKTDILKANKGIPEEYKTGDTYIRRKIGLQYDTLWISSDLTWWRQTPNQASQRVVNDIKNNIDSFNYTYEFIKESTPQLSAHENAMAEKNLHKKVSSYIWMLIKRLKWKKAMYVINKLTFKIDYKCAKHTYYKQRLFPDNDVTNPYMLDIKNNPFSK
jgi:glycosyltransferase involved in cell wall biosynthesis